MGGVVGHAEISGAGMVGLTAAGALASRGWTVTVHERDEQLREIGAGLSLWGNGVAAVRDVGALDRAVAEADEIQAWRLLDHRGKILQDEWLPQGNGEAFAVLRHHLHRALQERARELGVEFKTSSVVVGAREDGTLLLESGEERKADLVIGADGVHSPVREAAGLTKLKKPLNDGGGRHLIPRLPSDVSNMIIEQWDGGRRIGIVPCTRDQVYIYLCCPGSDREAVDQEHSLDAWRTSFPNLTGYIDRIPMTEKWRGFTEIYTHSWSRGKVAVVGDAASAMTPNLGQAACVGMYNAVALAHALAAGTSVEAALATWESEERPVTDHTQRYSGLYGRLGTKWPHRLQGARSVLVRRLAKSPTFQHHINQAARRVPGAN
jgi:2-polyprenyl-6-methoxyphenol hydroxylase-like FAD-dependent oxidoreductase